MRKPREWGVGAALGTWLMRKRTGGRGRDVPLWGGIKWYGEERYVKK
jgi:hypothetical protein